MKNFLLGILAGLILAAGGMYFYYKANIKKFEDQIKAKEELISKLNAAAKQQLTVIEGLKNQDSLLEEKIDTLKIKGDEIIKYVDTMSISDMQQFFTDRYGER